MTPKVGTRSTIYERRRAVAYIYFFERVVRRSKLKETMPNITPCPTVENENISMKMSRDVAMTTHCGIGYHVVMETGQIVFKT
jgi:hypothetical protein